jgi:hypothetical protein
MGRPFRRRSLLPRIDLLEGRTLLSSAGFDFGTPGFTMAAVSLPAPEIAPAPQPTAARPLEAGLFDAALAKWEAHMTEFGRGAASQLDAGLLGDPATSTPGRNPASMESENLPTQPPLPGFTRSAVGL